MRTVLGRNLATPLCAAAFAIALSANGIPALRHDWWWAPDRAAAGAVIVNASSGWLPVGLGAPYAIPDSYLLGTAIGLLIWMLGPLPALFVYGLGIGAALAGGARALAQSLGAGPIACACAQVFFTFNPWVYTKLVAGHTYMLLACGALALLTAALVDRRPRPALATFALVLTLAQLQFFLLAMVLALAFALRQRNVVPLITGVVISLPGIIGVAFDAGSLQRTPYTIAWEATQSVPLADAALLAGYFAHYTDHLTGLYAAAAGAAALTAAAGAALARSRLAFGFLLACVLSLLAAAGLHGPFPALFEFVIAHAPQSGVFRELYNFLGVTALAYTALAVLAANRSAFARWVWAAAALVLAATWIVYPPSAKWVDARTLPRPMLTVPAGSRFALFPAFQPLRFAQRGSGSDPDAYQRAGNIVPLNEYQPTYPVDVALAKFAQSGERGALAALGVAALIQRPWLHSDTGTLSEQQALPPPPDRTAVAPVQTSASAALPELSLGPLPRPVLLGQRFGAGNVLAADAAVARGPGVPAQWSALTALRPFAASNRFVRARDGWVDARFAFAERPDLGQAFGGVFTTSQAPFELHGGSDIIAAVEGALRSTGGRPIAATTHGYVALHLAADVHAVRCAGACALAAWGTLPSGVPLEAPGPPFAALAFEQRTPWIARAHLAPGGARLLRYNVRYDGGWAAYAGTTPLAHVRLDGVVNGFIVPPHDGTLEVTIVERVALAQFAAEVAGGSWLIALCARGARSRRHRTLPARS